jgi:hypothetical protein
LKRTTKRKIKGNQIIYNSNSNNKVQSIVNGVKKITLNYNIRHKYLLEMK